MPLTTDQGLCIRQWDWSETSQTVSIFGRETGILRCIAKGSKRENARFSGGIEVLTRAEFIANLKPTEGLTLLTAWDLQETFPAARARLSAFYAGMTMLALIHHALQEHDPHPPLFDALLAALGALDRPDEERTALLKLLWAVLSDTGHQPEVHRDVSTAAALADAPTYAFNPRLGGLTADDSNPAAWRVRAETIDTIRNVSLGQPHTATAASIDRATALLTRYYQEVFACDLPSMAQYRAATTQTP